MSAPVFLRLANDDLVNADMIGRIVRRGEKYRARYLAYDRDGHELGALYWGFDPNVLDRIIPATGQIYAAVITCYEQQDGSWETYVDRILIVGWRFESDTPSPVLADDPTKDALIAVPAGEGVWAVPFDCGGTLEFLKEEALRRAKQQAAEVLERSRKVSEAPAQCP